MSNTTSRNYPINFERLGQYMQLKQLADFFSCEVQDNTEIQGFSIDTRTLSPGQVFIALKGPHFDGHDYIQEAVAKGAAAILSEKPISLDVPIFKVEDSLKALTALSAWHRQQFSLPVFAITGSCGKTSVKGMLASILEQSGNVLATKGNLNNHIGVPLTLLRLSAQHDFAVIELGASAQGEIAHTVNLVKPDVAMINNISGAHLEGFGSLDGVAHAKAEIFNYFQTQPGVAVLNADDNYYEFIRNAIVSKTNIDFSLADKKADVYASNIQLDARSCANFDLHIDSQVIHCQLSVPGIHNVRNALAAAACAKAISQPLQAIQRGLRAMKGVAGRMNYLPGYKEALVIDDTYNASGASVAAALEVLSNFKGKNVLVLGDLAELGDYAESQHKEIGLIAKEKGIDFVLTCGNFSRFAQQAFGPGGLHFDNQQQLLDRLLESLDASTTVLVKGSRSAHMENIVQAIIKS